MKCGRKRSTLADAVPEGFAAAPQGKPLDTKGVQWFHPKKCATEAEAQDFKFGWVGNKTGQNLKTRCSPILTYSPLW